MTLSEALDSLGDRYLRSSHVELDHRYGAELKVGDRVDLSETPGVYELHELLSVRYGPTPPSVIVGREVYLVFTSGRAITTYTTSSWYVGV